MKEQYGITIFTITLLMLLFLPRPSSEPSKLHMTAEDRERLRKFGTIMRIVSEEMVAAADSDDIEEHLLIKAEQVFDDFARETDFPGPDRITRPIARRMVRPVVKSVIRYAEQKEFQLLQEQNEMNMTAPSNSTSGCRTCTPQH